ncbi:MAG: hypothetical protein AB7N71_02010 [Phycisphaerae bacterium]
MQWIAFVFLESPLSLAIVAFCALFVLLVYWRRTLKPRPLLVGLLITVVAFGVQHFVETRREWAAKTLEIIEAEATRAQLTTLQTVADPNFNAGDLDRETFFELAAMRLQQYPIREIDRKALELATSSDDRFTVRGRYRVLGDFGNIGSSFGCTVEFEFIRRDDGWRLLNMPPPSIATHSFPSWRGVGS